MYEYMIFHSPKGHHIPGSMRWVTTGQSGVFAIPSDSYRVHYLESSRGVVNPSTEILDNPTWNQVKCLMFLFKGAGAN